MIISSYSISSPGLVRIENQDNLYINGVYRNDITDNSVFQYANKSTVGGLYAVADGMGGEKHGELAALLAVKQLKEIVISDCQFQLTQYLMSQNVVICDLIMQNNKIRIGSTFVGLLICSERASIINIGDSRAYLYRDGILKQLSRDHTQVQQMIDMGLVSVADARAHPARHKLSQHLGIFPAEMVIEPYSIEIEIEEDDIFLLCSDGLTDMVDDLTISKILSTTAGEQEKAEMLFETALRNGGKDNITIVLIQAKEGELFYERTV